MKFMDKSTVQRTCLNSDEILNVFTTFDFREEARTSVLSGLLCILPYLTSENSSRFYVEWVLRAINISC